VPNGKYDPQCYTCKSFKPRPDRRSCVLHNFVMPGIVEFEYLCSDWDVPDHLRDDSHWSYVPRFLAGDEFRSMKRGRLYVQQEHPSELDTFEGLQRFVFDALIHDDPELGWSIYIESYQYAYFPAPDSGITVSMDGDELEFRVVDATRTQVQGGHREPNGNWIDHRATRTQRLAHSPDSRLALYNWLDRYLDAAAVVRDNLTKEGWALKSGWIPPIFAFIEETLPRSRYALRFNAAPYTRWLRNH